MQIATMPPFTVQSVDVAAAMMETPSSLPILAEQIETTTSALFQKNETSDIQQAFNQSGDAWTTPRPTIIIYPTGRQGFFMDLMRVGK